MVTHGEAAAMLREVERVLATRVEIYRVVIDPDGRVLRRVYRGSFRAPPGWRPPTLEQLIAHAKKG